MLQFFMILLKLFSARKNVASYNAKSVEVYEGTNEADEGLRIKVVVVGDCSLIMGDCSLGDENLDCSAPFLFLGIKYSSLSFLVCT